MYKIKNSDEIILSARKLLINEKKVNIEVFNKKMHHFFYSNHKSGMWSSQNKFALWKNYENSSLEDTFHKIQENGLLTVGGLYEKNQKKYFGFIINELLIYLKNKQNFDLFNKSEIFCEVPFSSPKISVLLNNRIISQEFLYKLIIALRIQEHISFSHAKVLEIGGGLGSLARCIKLLDQKVHYAIIDLPETLYFSYIFLKASFPHSKFYYVENQKQAKELNFNEHDFIFIPTRISSYLTKDMEIDIVCNTQSFGEMRQKNVLTYMQMIQEKLNVKFFYSINRFLQTTSDLDIQRSEDYQATCSLVLDPYWKIKKWNYTPEFLCILRNGADTECSLEVLLERVPHQKIKSYELVKKSEELLIEAQKHEKLKTHKWLRLIWESINLNPNQKNIESFYNYLKLINAREILFYFEKMKKFNKNIVLPKQFKINKPNKKTLIKRLLNKIKRH